MNNWKLRRDDKCFVGFLDNSIYGIQKWYAYVFNDKNGTVYRRSSHGRKQPNR